MLRYGWMDVLINGKFIWLRIFVLFSFRNLLIQGIVLKSIEFSSMVATFEAVLWIIFCDVVSSFKKRKINFEHWLDVTDSKNLIDNFDAYWRLLHYKTLYLHAYWFLRTRNCFWIYYSGSKIRPFPSSTCINSIQFNFNWLNINFWLIEHYIQSERCNFSQNCSLPIQSLFLSCNIFLLANWTCRKKKVYFASGEIDRPARGTID